MYYQLIYITVIFVGNILTVRTIPDHSDYRLDNTVISPALHPHRRHCPCQHDNLCQPISRTYDKEVFIFSVTNKNYERYDWSKVTTVVLMGYHDDQLLCEAHSNGARVLINADVSTQDLTNDTARHLWVQQRVSYVQENFLDGVNVDFESAIRKESKAERDGLTQYMRDLTIALKKIFPSYMVSMDFAWNSGGVDLRFYDYATIAGIIDLAFVMSYDERSQIRGQCVAWANSGLNNTKWGMETFLKQGIPPKKLVLGIPWYGYKYPCTSYNMTSSVCSIKYVPFRGVNCSDASGGEHDYSQIVTNFLPHSFTGRLWDSAAQSPYFSMKDIVTGAISQVWYDDPHSLSIKYKLVEELKLRGLGMWTADSIDYSNPGMIQDMWGAIPYSKHHVLSHNKL